jgi:hypothetical protein
VQPKPQKKVTSTDKLFPAFAPVESWLAAGMDWLVLWLGSLPPVAAGVVVVAGVIGVARIAVDFCEFELDVVSTGLTSELCHRNLTEHALYPSPVPRAMEVVCEKPSMPK